MNKDWEGELSRQVIGAAIEVHRYLGPGLLESAYEECLCHELARRKLGYKRQLALPLIYKGLKLECGYRLDLIVDEKVIIELKVCEALDAIHVAQMLTYLKLTGLTLGLIINFNTKVLKNGIRRIAL